MKWLAIFLVGLFTGCGTLQNLSRRHDYAPTKPGVRLYGGVAIVSGAANFDVTANGQELSLSLLFHSIWAQRPAGLQFVSWQATRLPARA